MKIPDPSQFSLNIFSFIGFSAFLLAATFFYWEGYAQATIFSKRIITVFFSVATALFLAWQLMCCKRIAFVKTDFLPGILWAYVVLKTFFFTQEKTFLLYETHYIELALLYVFLRTVLSGKNSTLYGLVLLGFLSFANAVYGLGQYFGIWQTFHSGFKITGSFFNPAPYAGYLSACSVACSAILFYPKNVYRYIISIFNKNHKNVFLSIRVFALVTLLLVFTVLLLTQSRAAWLAFLIMNTLLFINTGKISFSIKNKPYWQLLFFTFVIISLILLYFFKKDSADGRLLVWKITTTIIADFFWTGATNFKSVYMPYQAAYFKKTAVDNEMLLADNVTHSFNDFLEFFAEHGFLGCCILFLIILMSIKSFRRGIERWGHLILLSLGIFACFSYPMSILPIQILVVFAMAQAVCSEKKILITIPKVLKYGGVCICLFSAAFQLQKGSQLHRAGILWKKALNTYYSENYSAAQHYFENAFPIFRHHGEFLMHYGKTLSLGKLPEESNSILHKAENYTNNTVIQIALGDNYRALKKYNIAEKHYISAADMIPNRLYPHYLLAKMHQEKGDTAKAEKQAEILLQKNVKIPSRAAYEMQEEMKKLLKK